MFKYDDKDNERLNYKITFYRRAFLYNMEVGCF